MQDRRTFLGLAAASLLPIGLEAQTPTPRPPVELARHPLTGLFEGFEVVLVELNIPPGRVAPGPGHRHPGPVLGYVVEGQMRFAINNDPEKVLPVGGIKAKVLAAHRAGIRRIILPEQNRRDIDEVPEAALADLEILFVQDMADVLNEALETDTGELPVVPGAGDSGSPHNDPPLA